MEELPDRTAEGWQQATQELDTPTGLVKQTRSGDRACQLAKMVLAHRFQKLSCVAEKKISSCSNQREIAEVEMDGAEQENNSCTRLAAHM